MENENEYVKDKKVVITGVSINLNQGDADQTIRQIRFQTDDGKDITWKPRVLNEEHQSGILVQQMQPMKLNQLPSLVKQIGERIKSGKPVNALVSYAVFTKDVDGEEKSYRFIRSLKTLESWKIQ